MITREQFYKSNGWETFRKIVIAKRTDEDGFVHCAHCGKPITKKYDLIVHHIKELDDLNVNDVNVSLNEDNVEIVCFSCHNQIHERFVGGHAGTFKPVKKHVYIVYGSPCSGKSTWVHEVASDKDIVVDMDSIWQMISVNDRYAKPDALRAVAFDIRDKMYDIIKYRSGKWHNAYVITGGALKGDRERLVKRLGGVDDCLFIDTGKEECLKRIKNKFADEEQQLAWRKYIEDWFEKYQAD